MKHMDLRDRTTLLLAERATEGLDAARAAELERLLEDHPEWDDCTLELAAAAIDLALCGPTERLPDSLRTRLAATAAGFTGNANSSLHAEPSNVTSVRKLRFRRQVRLPAWSGWLAVAATLVVAALFWWSPGTDFSTSDGDAMVGRALVQQRAELMSGAADVTVLEWAVTEDPAAAGAGGDVVWSPSRQAGYMRIVGLEPNDPAQSQYQLWVFDAARDERFPVDGGVFDVPTEGGEVIIPIEAQLPIDRAILFAVTVEPPGGVVVSNRERIVLVAPAN